MSLSSSLGGRLDVGSINRIAAVGAIIQICKWSMTLDMDVGAGVVNNYACRAIHTMRYFICILNPL